MACDYCMGNCPHDSTHEGVMDWYEHYMAVSTREVTDAMQRDSIAARKAGKDRGDL